MTGTISTRPANAPTRSQYGSPIAQKPAERIAATMTMSTAWPRTNAPSLRSMSSQVSRTVFRFGRGRTEQTTSIARSRSTIQ